MEVDLTKMACCVRDEELQRKNNEVLRKLKEMDPVRKAEERRSGVFNYKIDIEHSHGHTHSHAHGCCTTEDTGNHRLTLDLKDDYVEESEEETESWMDDEDLEFLEQFKQTRLLEMQLQKEVTLGVQHVASIPEMRKVLEKIEGGFVAFFKTEKTESFTRSLLELATAQANQRLVNLQLFEVTFEKDWSIVDILKSLGVENGKTSCNCADGLCIYGFRNGPLLQVFDEKCGDKERRASMASILDSFTQQGNTSEDEEEDSFLCDKKGCVRKFPHQHFPAKTLPEGDNATLF